MKHLSYCIIYFYALLERTEAEDLFCTPMTLWPNKIQNKLNPTSIFLNGSLFSVKSKLLISLRLTAVINKCKIKSRWYQKSRSEEGTDKFVKSWSSTCIIISLLHRKNKYLVSAAAGDYSHQDCSQCFPSQRGEH